MFAIRTVSRLGVWVVTGLALAAMASPADAKRIDLKAMQYEKTLPSGEVVTMWGFAEIERNNPAVILTPPSSPGPEIVMGANDTRLTVVVYNELPAGAPDGGVTSFMAPGLKPVTTFNNATPPAPVMFTDDQGRQRVRSFGPEVAPDGTSRRVYRFEVSDPGTYVYHSGTHPALQVQMGLYGTIRKNAVGNVEAYPGVTFNSQSNLVMSEIDPALHQDVVAGQYGPGLARTSMYSFLPTYFLVNGASFDPSTLPAIDPNAFDPIDPSAIAVVKGNRHLIRMANLGYYSRVPVLNTTGWEVVAEDGHPYAYPRRQASVHVAAGQSRDVIFTGQEFGSYMLFDRAHGTSSAEGGAGGIYQPIVVHDFVRAQRPDLFPSQGNRLLARGFSDSNDPAVTMKAWAVYDNGDSPVMLGDLNLLRINAAGRVLFSANFLLDDLGIAVPDQVKVVSSLGGSHARAVVNQEP